MTFLLHQPISKPKPPPSNNAELFWPLSTISSITGAPTHNLAEFWTPIADIIAPSKLTQIGALANGATEVGDFVPINEIGGNKFYNGVWYDYFFYMYDINSPDPERRQVARDLGNIFPGDGQAFHGRGIIQLTGRSNYFRYGNRNGINLIADPELALQAPWASYIFAQFCEDHFTFDFAEGNNWISCRKSVNGGTTGWNKFIGIVNGLKAA